jgi:hypothetical protein
MKSAFHWDRCPTCGQLRKVINGSWLKDRRVLAGLTLKQVGAMVGVSAPYLCDVEKGRRNVTEKVLDVYAALRPRRVRR